MAGTKSTKTTNVSSVRKRVDAQSAATLKRARDGSAFVRCEECKKDVAAALISMHNCSLEAKLKLNLEAQVVESQAEIKKKPKNSEPTTKKAKKEKKPKDSTKLKRPPTAFFVFMEDFRKEFKEANPDNKSVSVVGKQGGEKWKSLTDEEKKPYLDKAAELKEEYKKAVEAQNDAENEEEDATPDDDGAEDEVKARRVVSDDEE